MPTFSGSSTIADMKLTDNDQLAALIDGAVQEAVDKLTSANHGLSTHLNTTVSIVLAFSDAHAKNTYTAPTLPVRDPNEAKKLLMGDKSQAEPTVPRIVKQQRDWALTKAGKEGEDTVSLTVSLRTT